MLESYLRRGGRALFLFDGLDEVFDPAQREEVAAQIATFANEYPGVLSVVTSRAAGYQRQTFANAGFDHFTLEDLDDEQITRFLDNWYRYVMPTQLSRRNGNDDSFSTCCATPGRCTRSPATHSC